MFKGNFCSYRKKIYFRSVLTYLHYTLMYIRILSPQRTKIQPMCWESWWKTFSSSTRFEEAFFLSLSLSLGCLSINTKKISPSILYSSVWNIQVNRKGPRVKAKNELNTLAKKKKEKKKGRGNCGNIWKINVLWQFVALFSSQKNIYLHAEKKEKQPISKYDLSQIA